VEKTGCKKDGGDYHMTAWLSGFVGKLKRYRGEKKKVGANA